MDLKLTDLANVLQVSKKTIYRWIKDSKIPFYRINHQYRFKTDEINEWAIQNKSILPNMDENIIADETTDIYKCVKKGGIYYNITGDNIYDAISDSLAVVNIPPNIERDNLCSLILKREREKTTAVKEGIVFLHSGTPVIKYPIFESISICFMHKPVQYDNCTDLEVHTLFIILAASRARHLRLLAKLAVISSNNSFIDLLKRQPLRKELLDYFYNIKTKPYSKQT